MPLNGHARMIFVAASVVRAAADCAERSEADCNTSTADTCVFRHASSTCEVACLFADGDVLKKKGICFQGGSCHTDEGGVSYCKLDCICENGHAAQAQCIGAGREMCDSCDDGYHKMKWRCFENECPCSNGRKTYQRDCPVDGEEHCLTCDVGYSLNHQNLCVQSFDDVQFVIQDIQDDLSWLASLLLNISWLLGCILCCCMACRAGREHDNHPATFEKRLHQQYMNHFHTEMGHGFGQNGLEVMRQTLGKIASFLHHGTSQKEAEENEEIHRPFLHEFDDNEPYKFAEYIVDNYDDLDYVEAQLRAAYTPGEPLYDWEHAVETFGDVLSITPEVNFLVSSIASRASDEDTTRDKLLENAIEHFRKIIAKSPNERPSKIFIKEIVGEGVYTVIKKTVKGGLEAFRPLQRPAIVKTGANVYVTRITFHKVNASGDVLVLGKIAGSSWVKLRSKHFIHAELHPLQRRIERFHEAMESCEKKSFMKRLQQRIKSSWLLLGGPARAAYFLIMSIICFVLLFHSFFSQKNDVMFEGMVLTVVVVLLVGGIVLQFLGIYMFHTCYEGYLHSLEESREVQDRLHKMYDENAGMPNVMKRLDALQERAERTMSAASEMTDIAIKTKHMTEVSAECC
mmetsp:Transcript_91916/g.163641  ORF Transcript_91916/g.163641 Transcript_91916/m.163641 type:complete len:628 (-) Transcript_91916:26-1909(-)